MSRLLSRISTRPSGVRVAVWRLSTTICRPSRLVWTSSPSQKPVCSSCASLSTSGVPSQRSKAWMCLAYRLGGGPAVEFLRAAVPGADDAVHLAHDQRVVGVVHHLGLVAQLRLVLAARGVGAVEGADGPPDQRGERQHHRQNQHGDVHPFAVEAVFKRAVHQPAEDGRHQQRHGQQAAREEGCRAGPRQHARQPVGPGEDQSGRQQPGTTARCAAPCWRSRQSGKAAARCRRSPARRSHR